MKDGLQDVGFYFSFYFSFYFVFFMVWLWRGENVTLIRRAWGDMVGAITDIEYHRADGGAVDSHRGGIEERV